ncbi:MAG: hypothetical protein AAB225_21120 [Acidobacteriota bacterium]
MLFTPLPCEEIVLRALLKRGWIDEESGRIKADAFILDPAKDKDGLSVNVRSRIDLEAWLAGFRRSFGADSLHTGRIRTLRLDVGQFEQDLRNQPDHAVITGLPYSEDDPERAESLASELAKMSRPVDRTMRRTRQAGPRPAPGH